MSAIAVHRVTLLVVDHDQLGEDGLRDWLEARCGASVLGVETREVEWRDDHPLNLQRTWRAEVERLFGACSSRP